MLSAEDLISFEADIAAEFNRGKIRAPIHLSGGNEDVLIDLFDLVEPRDWVCTNWRSHYHCLLKGVPPDVLKADIMAGKSITLNYPEHRVISSAIVGGILPIAVGIAMAIKRRTGDERVYVFMGDMTARTGIAHECIEYSRGNNLPIEFIMEDNGKSVCTDTNVAWGRSKHPDKFQRYDYELPFPHAGAGVRVQF